MITYRQNNNGKSYVSNSASASQTYPIFVTQIMPNQSGLKIDLIDMNGAWVCNHSQSWNMVAKFIVAVSKDKKIIFKGCSSGLERHWLNHASYRKVKRPVGWLYTPFSSTCLFYFNCGRVILPEALPTRTDFMLAFYGNGGSMIVYIGTLKKIIILAVCKYWDSWKSNYFKASQYIELIR